MEDEREQVYFAFSVLRGSRHHDLSTRHACLSSAEPLPLAMRSEAGHLSVRKFSSGEDFFLTFGIRLLR